jgi:hypothetical protein
MPASIKGGTIVTDTPEYPTAQYPQNPPPQSWEPPPAPQYPTAQYPQQPSWAPPPAPPAPAAPTKQAPWWRRWWAIATAGAIVGLIIGLAAGGGSSTTKTVAGPTTTTTATTTAHATTTVTQSAGAPAPHTVTVTVTHTPAAPPTPPPGATFGDGTWVVGSDIQPGVYKTQGPGAGGLPCYWARLSSLNTQDIIDNGLPNGPTTIEVHSGDKALELSGGCTWHKVG